MFNTLRIPAFVTAALALAAFSQAGGVLRLGLLGNKFDKPFATGVVGFAQERRSFEKAFEKDSVRIEWIFFKNGAPALNEGIANGKVDIAVYGDVGSIAGKGGGLPTRVIAPNGVGGGRNYILVPATSSIRKPEDLRNRRVALSRGTAPQLLFYRWARDIAKVPENQFRIINLSSVDQETAFASGAVDFLVSSNLDLVDRGLARVLYAIDTDKEGAFAGFGNVVATESYLKEHPEHVQTWVSTFVKVAADVLDERNRAEHVRVSTKNGTSAKNVRLTQPKDLLAAYAPVFDDYYDLRLRTAIVDCHTFGIIDQDIDADKWVVKGFLEKALSEQGLKERWSTLHSARLGSEAITETRKVQP